MTNVESSQMTTHRFTEPLTQLDRLIEEVRNCRPDNEVFNTQQRRTQKKKTTIKQLFTAASKFQRNLRRGVYLASILYNEDRVLVTNEDFIPIIEIDETFPSSIRSDLYWLMKVSCSWNEIKILRLEIEKNASSTLHFRTKMLSAIIQMQSSLGIQDLGQIYYKPLKDSRGTMVLSTVNYVKSPKNVSLLNSRWLPMNKILKKYLLSDEQSLLELLMASIQQQINYHQVSSLKLNKGLYLAYLKMQCSVEEIRVIVSSKLPNMLPHCKIRDNPRVTHEEWSYLKQNYCQDIKHHGTEAQKTFLELVLSACKRLFNYMEVNTEDILGHRIYDSEVIYLTEDISFIVICPSAELACSIPAKRELLLQRGDLLSLSIQVFEIIHFCTYKTSVTRKYAKLSCILEMDAATANHLHREAFSNTEVEIAKKRLLKLQELESQLNTIWKSLRWLMNIISFARDRASVGISIRCIVQRETTFNPKSTSHTLQVPLEEKMLNKSFGRGSWPGPGSSTPSINLTDISRSEQNLKIEEYNNYFHPILDEKEKTKLVQSSKSENILSRLKNKAKHQRARANTICNILPVFNENIAEFSKSTSNVNNSHQFQFPTSTLSKKHKLKLVTSKSMTDVKQQKSKTLQPNNVDVDLHLSKSLTNIKTYLESTGEDTEELETKSIFKAPKALRHPFSNKNESGIIQVFAAYETGLASGTSLKLHITPRTTAREIVDLVVKQLNMAVILKGKEGPVYNPDKLSNFCLVAVIGARERCLRDDFKPLHLQNPWRKGRLYVRQKHDVLAALEHSSRHSTII